MKVRSIVSYLAEIPMEEFVGSELAKTPMGQLLIALAAEKDWSGEYWVNYEKPILEIRHPAFLPDQPLVITEASDIMSVRGVEDAVRKHFHDIEKSLEPEISRLRELRNELSRASSRIEVDKAKAAIVAVFPEAADAYHNHAIDSGDLRCFVLNEDNGDGGWNEQVFLAREIDGEFVRGIAKMHMAPLALYELSDINRHHRFWEALARTFAARELQIPEDQMWHAHVAAKEKPFLWPRPTGYDPYIVEQVVLETLDGPQVDVEFGTDNLPTKVTLVPKPHVVCLQ